MGKALLLSLLGLFMVPATGQELFTKPDLFSEFEPVVATFQNLEATNTVGGYPILPIADSMKIAFTSVQKTTGVVVPQGRVLAISARDGNWLASLDTSATLSQATAADWVDSPCKRTDFLWKRSRGGEFMDVNCVSINHVVGYFARPTGPFQQLAVRIRENGISIPPTIIRIQFTRYAANMRRLDYVVDINPEQFGIERDTTSPWGSNSWHREFIQRDEKKVLFVAKMQKWATDVQERMDAAFSKSPQAFDGVPNLVSYLSDTERTGNKKASAGDKTESSLLRLKSLYEKGLLTESQYNDQVKSVLNESGF